MLKMASGGSAARVEFNRMIVEKVEAAAQLQTRLDSLGPDATPQASLDATLRLYGGKVSANRRRLSR
ncbi:MAG: hypothetical protein EON93_00915 [Burkholderiales bacterium]|jgi:hypothetical protein|nr:MAG: hypothetical protein EON93_00915 [Burkholderiales bacterium]